MLLTVFIIFSTIGLFVSIWLLLNNNDYNEPQKVFYTGILSYMWLFVTILAMFVNRSFGL